MKLVYSTEELLADHDYAKPHDVAGYRLHGGFDVEGVYRSPRTRFRLEAVANWRRALRARGGSELEIGLELLSGPRYPNFAQHKLLLENGRGETLWNSLTNIGRVEARGAVLATIPPPDLSGIVVDQDVREMTVGHLGPLFIAHGRDEGGLPEHGIGGHDQMWFAVRDLAFGEGRYPLPEAPPGPMQQQQPEGQRGPRFLPDLPQPTAGTLRFLMSLLMIEIRAFIGFQQNEALLRDPQLFSDRRREADEAAEIVARIRLDEEVHVGYLCNLFGELRHATLRCVDGSTRLGHEIIDPAWKRQVELSTVTNARSQRLDMQRVLEERMADDPVLYAAFDALTDPGAFEAAA